MEWTKDQRKVITTRNKNILVSAAAGSGKTAVLVERIIQRIMDKENPVNVDQMLIVTFTKLAANQMKEKIQSAIEKAVMENPEDEHLAGQLYYIRSAQISTIDGFCNYLVKNYYDRIDLNPEFRIGDEASLIMLRNQCVKEVLEDFYSRDDDVFKDCVDSCCYGNSDDYIEEVVLKLYDMSTSHVDPKKWLLDMSLDTRDISSEELSDIPWIKGLVGLVNMTAYDNVNLCMLALDLCRTSGGPIPYESAIMSDIEIYEKFAACNSYQDILKFAMNYSHARLSSIRKKELYDPDLIDRVKNMRKSCKSSMDKIIKNYFSMSLDDVVLQVNKTRPILAKVAQITYEFYEKFSIAKEDKGLVDFSDIEHFALKILTNENDPQKPSDVALQLSDFYEEIFIDEYQDSNDVQEAILTSIGNKRNNKPEIFMVGDVKQSIYGFRMAKPDLFIHKANTYHKDDTSDTRRIDLHKNFRSRQEVLEFTNYVFERIMSVHTGKIAYGEDEKLNTGASYPENVKGDNDCEFLIYNTHEPDDEDGNKIIRNIPVKKEEAELRMIAGRIRKIVSKDNGLKVTDTDSDGNMILRNAKYSDITVLFRGIAAWTDLINEVFTDEEIPFHIDNSTGYFSAVEVKTMLNMLRIICNPLQDIPLVGVMRSPIGGFSDKDIAIVKSENEEGYIYDAIKKYVKDHLEDTCENKDCEDKADSHAERQDSKLYKKLKEFLENIDMFRRQAVYLSIHELILSIYDVTGYYECVLAMSDGKRRRLNLDILANKASSFEQTGQYGLFDFINAMDKMDKYAIEMAQAESENVSDSVNIMTIHKSKGLEFPICILAGTGKKFNTTDTKNKIIIHQEYGLGMDYVNHIHRVRMKTLSKSVLSQVIINEMISEEERILYVAMTRAKEKLIISGSIDFDNFVQKNEHLSMKEREENVIPATDVFACRSYIEMILKALMTTRAMKNAMNSCMMSRDAMYDMNDICPLSIKIFDYDSISQDKTIGAVVKKISANEIYSIDINTVYDEEVCELLKKQSENVAYVPEDEFKTKVSVSELKKQSQLEQEDIDNHLSGIKRTHIEEMLEKIENEQKAESMSDGDKTKLTPAQIGTMYHKLFEIMPFVQAIAECDSKENIVNMIDGLAKNCALLKNWKEYINPDKIVTFLNGKLACRMANAMERGLLKREQQFVLGVSADKVYKDTVSDEMVLIQGIIDAYFEEDGQIILMDYKTDRVSKKDAKQTLSLRYKTQLDLYQEAIERLTHKKVRERVIYAVNLGMEFSI